MNGFALVDSALAAAAIRIAVLIGITGLGLVAARKRTDTSTLVVRLRTWVAIAVVWLGALAVPALGPVVLALILGVVGAWEYGRVTRLPTSDRAVLLTVVGVLPAATLAGGSTWMAALTMGALALTLPPLLAQDIDGGWDRIARSTLGLLWIGGGATAVAVLDASALLAVGLAVALADVGAFVGGRVAGRRPLAARLSPNKTRAGVLGAVVGAGAGVALVADLVGITWVMAPLIGLGVALCATWGDLLESLVKRSAGVKDAGQWLPGFGGLLDRADSLLVTAPAWWAVSTLLP